MLLEYWSFELDIWVGVLGECLEGRRPEFVRVGPGSLSWRMTMPCIVRRCEQLTMPKIHYGKYHRWEYMPILDLHSSLVTVERYCIHLRMECYHDAFATSRG
jgi:hypothetical protein